MTVAADKQVLLPGRRVELFELDLGIFQTGLMYRFCSSFKETGNITWKGNTYVPIPVEAQGFEVSGKGTLPTPTFKIANISLLPSSIINEFGDPIGAKVTRWVTFSDYLDGESQADPNQHFLPEIYFIERKVSQNKIFVEFELSASMDQEGRQLPARQILRDACTLRYRVYNSTTGLFDYTEATCPWAGSDQIQGGTEGPFFTAAGVTTPTPSLDRCGKKLSDCKLRFQPLGIDLPFGGFPGVGRTRIVQ